MKNILRHSLYFLCIISLLSLTGLARDERLYRVSRVVDGDTIQLEDGRFIRYIGIDTPEVRFRIGNKWVYRPQAYALEAQELNERWVGGKSVRLELDIIEKDRYTRTLGYVYVGDVMVNELMLKEGMAEILTIPPNVKYIKRFKNAESRARQAQKGIWQ